MHPYMVHWDPHVTDVELTLLLFADNDLPEAQRLPFYHSLCLFRSLTAIWVA